MCGFLFVVFGAESNGWGNLGFFGGSVSSVLVSQLLEKKKILMYNICQFLGLLDMEVGREMKNQLLSAGGN